MDTGFKQKHQVAFISAQTAPLVLGVLQAPQGSCLHGLATPEMSKQSTWLKAVLEHKGYKYKEHKLTDTSYNAIAKLLDSIKAEDGDVGLIVNLTGGTKLMSIAAVEWAVINDIPSFYIDTENKKIVLTSGSEWQDIALPDKLEYDDLLNAYGAVVINNPKWNPIPGELREQLTTMLKLACKEKTALIQLNKIAVRATKDLTTCLDSPASAGLQGLLQICQQAGKLAFEGKHVVFKDEEARKWCNGIWLEEYIQMALYKLKNDKEITSWASGVEVNSGGTKNELDAVFTVNNRLFVIECKTAYMVDMHPDDIHTKKAADIVYKAYTLRQRLGGTFSSIMICSINPFTKYDQDRARDYSIKVVSDEKLKSLDKEIKAWIAPNRS